MPYEMNQGGFLDGSFVQAQYDRNQEYEDMRRANADAESYMRQFKANLEIEALLKERDRDLSLAAQAIPPGWKQKSLTIRDGKPTSEWGPPDELGGGRAEYSSVSGRGGHWVLNKYTGKETWVSDPAEASASSGGWDDPSAALKWAQSNGIANPKVTFEGGKYRVLPGEAPVDEFDQFRALGRRGMFNALLEGNTTKARNAAKMVNGLPVTMPSPLGGTVGVDLATAGEDPLTRALGRFAVDPVTNTVGSATNSTPVGASSPAAPVSSGGTVLQMGMDGSVTGAPRAFASEADAQAAAMRGELQNGDIIVVNGRKARWRN
jgi:hypothetical protein